MIEFIIGLYACSLVETYAVFQELARFDAMDMTFDSRHCTDWGNKAASKLGYSYGGREFNGWVTSGGPALAQEVISYEGLKKVKAGWMIEFVNNNRYNGRHAIIVQKVINTGKHTIDVQGVGASGNSVKTKIYRLGTKESGAYENHDYMATFNVPVIATYKPLKNDKQ